MAAISFLYDTRKDWDENVIDHRLKTFMRDIALEFGGAWLTCLSRTPEKNAAEHGKPNSKHLLNGEGKCEAADWELMDRLLNDGVIPYCEAHWRGIKVIYHKVKDGRLHFHAQINDRVELLA